MRVLKNGLHQFVSDQKILAINALTILLFLGFFFYVKFGWGEDWRRAENVIRLFSDCFTKSQPFYSYLNNVSEILWSFSFGICLFSFLLLRSFHPQKRPNSFLFYSTLLIALLMLDDMFRFTLILALFLKIPKILMYVFYGLAFIVFSIYFRHKLASTPYAILIVGLCLFIFSNTIDLIPLVGQATPVVLEEGSKLLGLLNFAYYYWLVCWSNVTQFLQKAAPTSASE